MWLSASAFFYQYFRVYSPISFGKKTDPNGEYIKKYIPVLSKYPAKYIYEPWKAPLNIQKDAKCIIGVDYPFPIVDHTVVSKKNMERMSKYYGGKQGEEWYIINNFKCYMWLGNEIILCICRKGMKSLYNWLIS